MARKKLIAGNWKMNGLLADGIDLAKNVASGTYLRIFREGFPMLPGSPGQGLLSQDQASGMWKLPYIRTQPCR